MTLSRIIKKSAIWTLDLLSLPIGMYIGSSSSDNDDSLPLGIALLTLAITFSLLGFIAYGAFIYFS